MSTYLRQISSRLVHIPRSDLPTWSLAGEFQIKRKNTGVVPKTRRCTLITHGMYPLTVIGVLHLSRENQSYPKAVPGPILVVKNGPILPKLALAGPNLANKIGPGEQFWLPKRVPSCQNWSPNLANKIGPGDHFWQLKVVPWTSLGCYKWSCMLEG